jgi:DNA polymerase III subunit epsilon
MKNFISIDVETSGLNPQRDRVVEIAAVRFSEDGQEISRFSQLVNPGVVMSDEVIRIHNISNEMVADAPLFREVFSDFLNFIHDDYDYISIEEVSYNSNFIAHNSSFDTQFINEELKRYSWMNKFSLRVTDSLALARRKYRYFPNHRLGTLASKLELPPQTEHRALGDCLLLKDLWVKSQWHMEPEQNLRKYRISNR